MKKGKGVLDIWFLPVLALRFICGQTSVEDPSSQPLALLDFSSGDPNNASLLSINLILVFVTTFVKLSAMYFEYYIDPLIFTSSTYWNESIFKSDTLSL